MCRKAAHWRSTQTPYQQCGCEQGIENPIPHQHNLETSSGVAPKEDFLLRQTCPRSDQQKSRLAISKQRSQKNSILDPAIFKEVCQQFKCNLTVDLFASHHNKQLPRYCAWRVDPKSLGSAWDLDWSKEVGWCNPPWELIPQTLAKIKQDRAKVLCCCPIGKHNGGPQSCKN